MTLELRTVNVGQIQEEFEIGSFVFTQRKLRLHHKGLFTLDSLVASRADLCAQSTTGAVFRSNLDSPLVTLEVRSLVVGALECFRSVLEQFTVVNLGTNGCVRADDAAFTTLDTQVRVPDRNIHGNIALFPLSRTERPCTINRENGNRQILAVVRHHRGGNGLDEIRGLRIDGRRTEHTTRRDFRNFNLIQVRDRVINRCEVLFDYCRTFLAVGLFNGLLDGGDGIVFR